MSLPLDILLAIDLPRSAQHHKWFLSMRNLIFGGYNGKDLLGSDSLLQERIHPMPPLPSKTSGLWRHPSMGQDVPTSFFFFPPCLKLSESTEQQWFHVSFWPATFWPSTFFIAVTILSQKIHICLT